MSDYEKQQQGVLLGQKARKFGIALIIAIFFAWTGIAGVVALVCGFIGFQRAKLAKTLAPNSPIVQSTYALFNILRWVCIIVCGWSFLVLIVYIILYLFGVIPELNISFG